jgi:cytoskeleton protein RodZ
MAAHERGKMRLTMSGAEDRPADFGAFLRQAREARGLSLQQLSIATKIGVHALESLERNEPAKLPGGIFSRSFVRAYAREVGLDPEVTVSRFVAAFPDAAGADAMPVPATPEQLESFDSQRRMAVTIVRLLGISLIVLVVALIVYSLWQRRAPAAPSTQSSAAGGSQATDLPRPAAQPREAAPASSPAPAVDTPAPGGPAASEPTAAPQPPVSSAPAAADASAGPGGSAAPLIVGLVASEDCWLSVTVDGATLAQRTLGAGERTEYRGNRTVTLRIGNAGALSMTVNGKPAKSLGGRGQTLTTTITPDTAASFLQ